MGRLFDVRLAASLFFLLGGVGGGGCGGVGCWGGGGLCIVLAVCYSFSLLHEALPSAR